ncbi:MAG: hypothetical protein ABJB04_05770, partial [Betaproteobacteria bacterium]
MTARTRCATRVDAPLERIDLSLRLRGLCRSGAIALLWIASISLHAQPVVFEGDRVSLPLTSTPGDPARGKSVLVQREKGHCILCHALPESDVKFAGNIGPPLAGVGLRLTAAQIRGRIVD